MLTATEQKMRVPKDFNPFHATHEISYSEALAHLVRFYFMSEISERKYSRHISTVTSFITLYFSIRRVILVFDIYIYIYMRVIWLYLYVMSLSLRNSFGILKRVAVLFSKLSILKDTDAALFIPLTEK